MAPMSPAKTTPMESSVGVDDPGGDRRRDHRAEHEERDEVEHRGPDDRDPG